MLLVTEGDGEVEGLTDCVVDELMLPDTEPEMEKVSVLDTDTELEAELQLLMVPEPERSGEPEMLLPRLRLGVLDCVPLDVTS
jgi:hypothetical protein